MKIANVKKNTLGRAAWLVVVAAMLAAAGGSVPRAAADETARATYGLVREGNRLLEGGQFEEALGKYDEALAAAPDAPEVAYNRGLALYRLGRFEEARKAFQDAIRPSRPELESAAKYNLGRTAHAEAMEHAGEPQRAIDDLSRAINFYNDALKAAPRRSDADTATNLELAERMRTYFQKVMQQQEQQQSPSSQPSDDATSQPSKPQPAPATQPQENQPGDPEQSAESQSQQSPEESTGEDDQSEDSSQSQADSQQQEGRQEPQASADQTSDEGDQQGAGEAPQRDERDPSQAQPKAQEKDDQQLREEEVGPMLQEARDAEKARREARRQKMLRQRGRTVVPKDW